MRQYIQLLTEAMPLVRDKNSRLPRAAERVSRRKENVFETNAERPFWTRTQSWKRYQLRGERGSRNHKHCRKEVGWFAFA